MIQGAFQQIGDEVADRAALAAAACHKCFQGGLGHGDREALAGAEGAGGHQEVRKDCLRIGGRVLFCPVPVSGSPKIGGGEYAQEWVEHVYAIPV